MAYICCAKQSPVSSFSEKRVVSGSALKLFSGLLFVVSGIAPLCDVKEKCYELPASSLNIKLFARVPLYFKYEEKV